MSGVWQRSGPSRPPSADDLGPRACAQLRPLCPGVKVRGSSSRAGSIPSSPQTHEEDGASACRWETEVKGGQHQASSPCLPDFVVAPATRLRGSSQGHLLHLALPAPAPSHAGGPVAPVDHPVQAWPSEPSSTYRVSVTIFLCKTEGLLGRTLPLNYLRPSTKHRVLIPE